MRRLPALRSDVNDDNNDVKLVARVSRIISRQVRMFASSLVQQLQRLCHPLYALSRIISLLQQSRRRGRCLYGIRMQNLADSQCDN